MPCDSIKMSSRQGWISKVKPITLLTKFYILHCLECTFFCLQIKLSDPGITADCSCMLGHGSLCSKTERRADCQPFIWHSDSILHLWYSGLQLNVAAFEMWVRGSQMYTSSAVVWRECKNGMFNKSRGNKRVVAPDSEEKIGKQRVAGWGRKC